MQTKVDSHCCANRIARSLPTRLGEGLITDVDGDENEVTPGNSPNRDPLKGIQINQLQALQFNQAASPVVNVICTPRGRRV